jgi:hypothetical protein
MLRFAGQAPRRFRPLSSNVRPHLEPWHLPTTYALIQQRFGAPHERLARESIRSTQDRQQFASYHYTEVLRLTRDFTRRHLGDSLLIDLHGQDRETRRAAFERYILKVGAHATAAVQSIHAIPDTLAFALYHATGLGLGPQPIAPRKISVRTVVEALRTSSSFSSLAPFLARSSSGQAFAHVAALSNMGKHRSLVRTSLNEDWTGKRKNRHEVHFKACQYEGQYFPSSSLQAVLEPANDHVVLSLLETGHELTACLRRDAA